MQQDLNSKSAKIVKLNQSENDNVNNWKAALLLRVDIFTKLIDEN
jgi:hypothetical protein